VRDGKVLTRCAASRNSKGYIASLADIEADNPTGDIFIITDNLSSHSSLETRTWLEEHPRIHHVFIPTGACWLNLQGGGGGSSAVMRWLVRVLPTPRRSSQPRASQLLNSTCGPSPGSGDVLLRITATIADSFVIAFNERSTRLYCDHFAKCCRIFQQVGFPSRMDWLSWFCSNFDGNN